MAVFAPADPKLSDIRQLWLSSGASRRPLDQLTERTDDVHSDAELDFKAITAERLRETAMAGIRRLHTL